MECIHTGLKNLKPNPQDCPFCGKRCKNINSYKQHICRCKNNPNRIESAKRDYKAQYANLSQESKDKMAWNRGLTADTDERVKLNAEHRIGIINNNYEDNLNDKHNQQEINKWFDYISNIDIKIDFKILYHHNGYPTISNIYNRTNNTIEITFVHDYIANILLGGNLVKTNTVHHIDRNKNNFDKNNLMVFESLGDHNRFHNSKYAKLVYNQETHLFSCYIDKTSE